MSEHIPAAPSPRTHGDGLEPVRPAATMVVVKELLDPRWRIEMEAEAQR